MCSLNLRVYVCIISVLLLFIFLKCYCSIICCCFLFEYRQIGWFICGLAVCVVIRFKESSRTSCRLFNAPINITTTIIMSTMMTTAATTKNITDLFRNWYEINTQHVQNPILVHSNQTPVKMDTNYALHNDEKRLWLKLRLETPNYSSS